MDIANIRSFILPDRGGDCLSRQSGGSLAAAQEIATIENRLLGTHASTFVVRDFPALRICATSLAAEMGHVSAHPRSALARGGADRGHLRAGRGPRESPFSDAARGAVDAVALAEAL